MRRMRARYWFAFLFAGVAGCGKDDFTSGRHDDAGGGASGGETGGAGGSHTGGASAGGKQTGGAPAGGTSTGGASTGGSRSTGGSHSVEAGVIEGGLGSDGGPREGSAPKGCSPITTFAELQKAVFGNPEPLSKLNAVGADVQLRHPRAFGNTGGLLYEAFYLKGTIWLTGDQDTDIGAPMSSPINQLQSSATEPLWWQDERPGALAHYNFAWSHSSGVAGEPGDLYGATVDGAGIATNAERMPAPFNAPTPTTQSSYGLALSRDRAWWTANLDSALNLYLYTAPLDGSSPPSLLTLTIENDCEVRELLNGFGTWVTPNGKLLFSNASERDNACQHDVGAPSDIYAFDLDETGKPIGNGHRLAFDRPGTSEADLSLSPDFCTLYYVANDAPGGPMRIQRMRRLDR
jgi:hypothetical protein